MVARKRSIPSWSNIFHQRRPRALFKRRSRLPLSLFLVSIITLHWYVNLSQPRTRNDIQRLSLRYKAIISQSQRLRYQLKMLTFKFDLREHVNAIGIRTAPNGIASWPAAFNNTSQVAHQDHFQKWPIVIRVDCSIENFSFFLQSLREALVDSKTTVICVFALTCRGATRDNEVASLNMINDLEICVKYIWNVTESVPEDNLKFRKRHRRIEQLQKPKLQWWHFISRFFQGGIEEGVFFNGILRNFKQDVLFVDSNVILSRDFLKVATYASKMKARLPGITQLSLGTWGGQNLINAHPDTFAVRKSRGLHALVYGMNISNWKTLSNLQEQFLEDLNPVWTESVGDAVNIKTGGFGVQSIVPTLSRYWFMAGPTNVRSGLARPRFPSWLFSPRPISYNNSRINVGVRDALGFLCKNAHTLNDGSVKNAICYCSFWIWEKTKLHSFPRCFPQGNDDCLDSY